MTNVLTLTFVALIVLNCLLRIVLSLRQIKHISVHQGSVPPDFADRISLEDHQKAAAYTLRKTRLGMWEVLFSAAILLIFTLLGGLNFLNHNLQWFDSVILNGMLLLLVFLGLNMLLELPFSYYSQFVIEKEYGFNRMSSSLFWWDTVKGLLLGGLIGIPLMYVVLWFLAEAGSLWWLYTWAAWAVFSLVMMVLYPSVIAPLFNKFNPMEDGELKTVIENLLQRFGFRSSGLFVMDGSRRSTHGNAYFTGLGKSKRIVFFDTLLSSLNSREVEAVLAHELGHFKYKHILRRLVSGLVLSFVMFYVLAYLKEQNWFYLGLGVDSALLYNRDALALLLFMLVLPLLSFILQPFLSALSRRQEFEADNFAAKHTRAEDLISALVKMYQDNASTLTPDPWYVRFYYSHPPATTRIAALRRALA